MGLVKSLFAAQAGRSALSRLTGSRGRGGRRRRRGTGGLVDQVMRSVAGGGRRRF